MTLSPGDRVAAYEILGLLGSGGMGEVYRARDTRLRREVALKVLPETMATDAEVVARFEREAQAVAALSHPNIVQIFDVGSDTKRAWAVTELLEGETLRERLRRGRLDEAELADIAHQIVDGVAAAHAKGIVHRDLKPENVFVTADGRVKILDFGLAKRELSALGGGDADATLAGATIPGTVLGTVGYMAPEQVRGHEVDARADLFALGAMLYEMATGSRSFVGSSAVEILSDILHREPDFAALSPALEPIVRRLMAKDRDRRYGSAGELRQALRAAAGATGSGTSASGSGRPGGALPALAGAAPAPEQAIAVLPFANLSPDPDTEYFSDGVTDEVINTLSRLPGLRVAARTSSFHFKEQNVTIAEVGRALNVRSVVEGSVRRAGDRVRISAQLVEVATGYPLWSERFDRKLDDIFALQDEIAAAIAERLRLSLSGSSQRQGRQAVDLDPEAYQLYLKGRFCWERRSIRQAIDWYRRSIEKQPELAAAHAGLAQALAIDGFMGRHDPAEVMPQAKSAARLALGLDPGNVLAEVVSAVVAWLYSWDGAEAEAAFQRALDRGPNDVEAHIYHGLFLAATRGRFDEALAHTARALEIDPLSESVNSYQVMVLTIAGRNQEAIAHGERYLEMEARSYLTSRMLGLAYYALGRFDDAAAALEITLAESDRHTWGLVDLGLVRLAQGRRADAEALQEEAIAKARSFGTSASYLALLPFHFGEIDTALGFLREGVAHRDSVLAITNHWPTWQPLRRDERIRPLLESVGY